MTASRMELVEGRGEVASSDDGCFFWRLRTGYLFVNGDRYVITSPCFSSAGEIWRLAVESSKTYCVAHKSRCTFVGLYVYSKFNKLPGSSYDVKLGVRSTDGGESHVCSGVTDPFYGFGLSDMLHLSAAAEVPGALNGLVAFFCKIQEKDLNLERSNDAAAEEKEVKDDNETENKEIAENEIPQEITEDEDSAKTEIRGVYNLVQLFEGMCKTGGQI